MKTEFNLSDKVEKCMCEAIEQSEVYQEKDVKEFIRLLKKNILFLGNNYLDELAGDKLK